MELADRLPFCPRCMYTLIGLPDVHHCPECGQPYDDHSCMWTSPPLNPRKRRLRVLASGFFFLFLFVVATVNAFQPQWVVYRIGRAVFAMLCLVMGVLLLRDWLMNKGPQFRFLAIMPEGLWFTHWNDRIRSIPWKRMKSANVDWLPLIGYEENNAGHVVRIHLLPKGRIDVPAGFMSSVQVHDVISRIMSRVEKAATSRN